ncbi:metallophosphoesterase [Fodinibius sp.]|uniref:metallophosphoesterase n=1 Tax=Fodinibius sp. TaxID=1872440 RepID=UPI003567094B
MRNAYLLLVLFILTNPLSGHGQYPADGESAFLVKPYLQFATQTEISILWETNDPATSTVRYGKARYDSEEAVLDQQQHDGSLKKRHELTLRPLEPETNYFYRVVSITEGGDTLETDILPFKTAVEDTTPFAFTVFSDSQSNPEIWKKITNQALGERPNFALHAGDQVGLGYRKEEWIEHFFAPSHNFMKQVPLFTIPGNHEHDAAYYYDYFKNPPPEHYYRFKYGNAEFFVIDTNQYQEPGTRMYHWLEHALASSDATWKIMVQHHPPYTSEENDYGDTRHERSTHGDAEAKLLVPLYEKHGVDLVFYGHIHMYERTWPILEDKPVEQNGVRYINVGGAGGSLEQAAPTRTWFSKKMKSTYHFASVAINGQQLQYQAIDEQGNVFDQFGLTSSREKKAPADRSPVTPIPRDERRIFQDTIHVHLKTVHDGDTIFYSLDGSKPGPHSRKAEEVIVLDQSRTLKTMAVNKHGRSRVGSYEYRKVQPFERRQNGRRLEQGITYQYFTGSLQDEMAPVADQLKLESSGTVSVPDVNGFPHRKENWGAVFEGYMEVPDTGYYRFYGHAYHLFRFHLHGELMIEEYSREIDGRREIYLEQGRHPFRIEYYTDRPYSYMRFEYTGPDNIRKPVSELEFYHE